MSSEIFAFWMLVVVDVWHWTPFVTLTLLAGLSALPEEVLSFCPPAITFCPPFPPLVTGVPPFPPTFIGFLVLPPTVNG